MAVRSITDPTINKISLAEYNGKVASGQITDTMIEEQVWIDKDVTVPVQHKLIGIEDGAQVNKIETIKVNGVEQAITDKVVDITCSSLGAIENETDPTVPAWAKAETKPTYTYDEITGKPALFSGSYNDLTDKPTIPSIDGLASETFVQNAVSDKATTTYVDTKVADLVNSAPETLDTLGEVATAIQNNATVVEALNSAIGTKANTSDLSTVATSGSYNDLSDKPTLFSGSYNDLTDKPTGAVLKIWTAD